MARILENRASGELRYNGLLIRFKPVKCDRIIVHSAPSKRFEKSCLRGFSTRGFDRLEHCCCIADFKWIARR